MSTSINQVPFYLFIYFSLLSMFRRMLLLDPKIDLDMCDRIFILSLLSTLPRSECIPLSDYLGYELSLKDTICPTVPIFSSYCHSVHSLLAEIIISSVHKKIDSTLLIDIDDIFLDKALESMTCIYSSSSTSLHFVAISSKHCELLALLVGSERSRTSLSLRKRIIIGVISFFRIIHSISSELRPSIYPLLKVLQLELCSKFLIFYYRKARNRPIST